ncbi:MAG: hypothetical protein ACE5G9_12355 [Nitrospinales bacterium]
MNQNRIFREELPGEKKSIMTLLMTGYFVAVSCMGYVAFYIYIQLSQMDRIIAAMNNDIMTAEQLGLLQDRVLAATGQLRHEVIILAVIGTIVCIVGGLYIFNIVVRPLEKLIEHTRDGGKTPLPEFKSNHEIKQLATAIADLHARQDDKTPVDQ